jgi:hypothetical protein
MSSTMLQLIQQAAAELGTITVPTYVAGNPAADSVQLLALMNAVGYELIREHEWQQCSTEYRFSTEYTTTTGTVTDGSAIITSIPSTSGLVAGTYMVTGEGIPNDTYISSIDGATQVTMTQAANASATAESITFSKTKYSFPADYDRSINNTDWDKSMHWQMIGPMTAQQWQWIKSGWIATGPRVCYRKLGGYFQIWPPLSAADLLGFEYVSTYWALTTGGTPKAAFTIDTDTCIFPDRLMVLGLKKKYFEIKGFDTTAFYRDYMAQLDIAKAGDAGNDTLSFAPRTANILISQNNIPDSNFGLSS